MILNVNGSSNWLVDIVLSGRHSFNRYSKTFLFLFQVFVIFLFFVVVIAISNGGLQQVWAAGSPEHLYTFSIVYCCCTQHMPYLVAIVASIYPYRVSYSLVYCCCTQHMPYLVAIVASIYPCVHVVHYTNISTCHILLLLQGVISIWMLGAKSSGSAGHPIATIMGAAVIS